MEAYIGRFEPLLESDLTELRSAIFATLELSLGDVRQSEAWLFLRIVNRIVFEVPEYVEPGFESYGGFFPIPWKEGQVNELWPLLATPNGLRIGRTRTGYLGDVFDAVGEFDEFNRRFGRRVSLRLAGED